MKIENILPKVERTFLPVGSTIGKYRIIEEIDRGGMAVVYKALQLDLDREVALKVLPANITINRTFVDRFLSEAHAVAKLNHRSIVSIYEVGMEDNIYFLAMEYVQGKNLYYFLNSDKPKLVDVVEIVARLADALGYAHREKIVHRDLKLNNVIMKDRLEPVLIDFGLAKALESEEGGITQPGEIMGSPAYMAPERLMGKPTDGRSDICSLGIMLYEMLTFKNPYLDPRSIHQTAMNVLESTPIPPRNLVPWLPSELEAVTLKAIHRDPLQRYQTMEEFREDLGRFQRGDQVLAKPPSLFSKARHFLRKNWSWAVIALLFTFFSTLFGISLYRQSRKEQPHWQLVFQEEFDGGGPDIPWTTGDDGGVIGGDSRWKVRDGALVCEEGGSGWVRLERLFTRDVKIEFDVRAVNPDFGDLGFFLWGMCPDSAYRFHIHHRGTSRSGISYPGSSLLFTSINPLTFPVSRSYHVVIEKRRHGVSFSLNGMTIATLRDFFPPLGRRHQQIGFFTRWCGASFDNLRIYRLAVPLLSSPTLVADRFWERGDFEAALDEYRALLVDFPNTDMIPDILLGIADCLIRKGRYGEVEDALWRVRASEFSNEEHVAHARFLHGILQRRGGNPDSAFSSFLTVARKHPRSEIARAAVVTMILQAAGLVADGRPGGAIEKAEILAADLHSSESLVWLLHKYLMDHYLSRKDYERGLELGKRFLRTFGKNARAASQLYTDMGICYLNMKQQRQGVEMFNRGIAASLSSAGAWEAWLMLGDVYEHDLRFDDAYTIYRKVWEDCPRTAHYAWTARTKMGEIASAAGADVSPRAIFEDAAGAMHPFLLPRLIALYYTDRCTAEELREKGGVCGLTEEDMLYIEARKALLGGEHRTAAARLHRLRRLLKKGSWQRSKVERLLKNRRRW